MKKQLPIIPSLSWLTFFACFFAFIPVFKGAITTFAEDGTPVAICQDVVVSLDSYGNAEITASTINNESYDPEGGALTFAIDRTIFGCDDLGDNEVVLTVTDQDGNQATCTATVTVQVQDLKMLVEDGFEIVIKSNVAFENDFETQLHNNYRYCSPDFAQNLVSDLYGDIFDQQWTVETMIINGEAGQYSDPQGKGGDFCLGMLSSIQNDKVAFTFNRQDLDFINYKMDVSAIDVPRCGGPFGVDVPKFNLKLYNTPSGQFNFGDLGALLDEANVEGIEPGATPYTFNWTEVSTSLDASAATNGFVTVVIDQLQSSGYAALDNIVISSSDTEDRFTNQVLIDEGETAWLSGSFEPGLAKNVSINASIGTATIDNEAGTWYWEYDTQDGPDQSQKVYLSLSNNCATESFDFDLIVFNVEPSIEASSETATIYCGQAEANGTFTDPGLDDVTITASYGTITQDFGQSGTWSWNSEQSVTEGDSVVITATDSDGLFSEITLFFETGEASADIELSAEIATFEGGFNEPCNGDARGSIKLTVTGGCAPYTYEWADGSNGPNLNGLPAGDHTVVVTDASGNSVTETFTLTQPDLLTITGINETVYLGYGPEECATISGIVAGGVPGYSYEWSNGATTESITVCPTESTVYTVTVTDANGCISLDQVYVCVNDIRVQEGTEMQSNHQDEDAKGAHTHTHEGVDNSGKHSEREGEKGKGGQQKLYVCHVLKNGNTSTIYVAEPAVEAHLAHGDYLGPCNEQGSGEVDCESDMNAIEDHSTLESNASIDAGGEDQNDTSLELLHWNKDRNGISNTVLSDFSVFPNPSNVVINVRYNVSNEGTSEVTLTNTLGQVVWSVQKTHDLNQAKNQQLEINTANLPEAMYLLTVSNTTQIITKRIQVKH